MNVSLTPFWYTPEGQPDGSQVSFHLRPLTQPQLVDVEQERDGKAQWLAGTLGIIAVRGAVHPVTGQPAAVPDCFNWLPRSLVKMAGLRLVINDRGLSWDELVAGKLPGTEPHEDPKSISSSPSP